MEGNTMCGIGGVISLRAPLCQNIVHSLRHTARLLAHRGPDHTGFWSDQHAAIFHKKLSILDQSTASHQPIFHAGYVLSFNGEIYNFEYLARHLPQPVDRPTFDGEVLLHGYIQLGDRLWPLLDGDFAVALYDRKGKELTLAVDRAGVKPLFVAHTETLSHFASEAKVILGLGTIPTIINDDRLISDLLLGPWSGRENSYFVGVDIVKPGTIVKINAYGSSVRSYWSPPAQVERSQWPAHRFAEEFSDAVYSRTNGPATPCLFLSGGVDSSLIAVNAAQTLESPLRSYTTSYEPLGATDDEIHVRRLAATVKNLDTSTVFFDVSCVSVGLLDELTWHLEEPVWDPVYMAVFQNYKAAARDGYRVVLTGQGADELWDGYHLQELLFQPPLRNGNGKFDLDKIYNHFFRELKRTELFFRRRGTWVNEPAFGGKALGDDRLREVFGRSPWAKAQAFSGIGLNVDTALQFSTVLQRNLIQEDRLGMAVSIESRVPYLTNGMVDLAFGCPAALKTSSLQDKLPLRALAVSRLPYAIAGRRKRPFPSPATEYWERIGQYTIERLGEIVTHPILKEYFCDGLPLDRFREVIRVDLTLAWKLAAIDRFLAIFLPRQSVEVT